MDDIHPEIQNIVLQPIIHRYEATQKVKNETSVGSICFSPEESNSRRSLINKYTKN